MFRFWFTDTDTSNALELKRVVDVAGLGLPPVELSQIGSGTDGTVVTNVKYGARPFTILFDTDDDNSLGEMRRIGEYFADNKPKTFWVQDDGDAEPKHLTPVYLSGAVNFDVTDKSVKEMVMPFVASDPWFKVNRPYTNERFEGGLLEFTLNIPEDGIELSDTYANGRKDNGGHKTADTIIKFKGGADHPYVENLTTGEKLTVSRKINVSQTLEINSATCRVEIIDADGTRHNAFNYIGDDEDFIHLARGANAIDYGAETTVGSMEVMSIEYFAAL